MEAEGAGATTQKPVAHVLAPVMVLCVCVCVCKKRVYACVYTYVHKRVHICVHTRIHALLTRGISLHPTELAHACTQA